MNEEKKTNIRKNLLKLSFVFPDRKLAIEGIDIYCEMLEDLPDDIIIQAIKVCLCECKFFPSIADIRERAKPFIKLKNLNILTLPDNYDERMREEDKKRRKL